MSYINDNNEIAVAQIQRVKVPDRVFKPMHGITRAARGWQVRLGNPIHKYYYTSHFADSTYGGEAAALIAAQADRDEQIKSEKYLRWVIGRRMGRANTTGAHGVSCTIRCGVKFNILDDRGRQAVYESIYFAERGAWYGYKIALNMRAEFAGGSIEPEQIARLYDAIFLPNWRERIARVGVEWRRD